MDEPQFDTLELTAARRAAAQFLIRFLQVDGRRKRRSLVAGLIGGAVAFVLPSGAWWMPYLMVVVTWFMFESKQAMMLVSSGSEALAPALARHPSGLDDIPLAVVVLDRAGIHQGRPDRVKAKLVEAAAWAVAADGPARHRNCSGGHPPICAHRVSAEGISFWSDVADGRGTTA